MRFGRIFALVAGGLALCIALLLLAVFVTRDEDNIQADNLLAERFTKAIALAPENDDGTRRSPRGRAVRLGPRAARAGRDAAGRDLTPARAASGPASTPSTAATC